MGKRMKRTKWARLPQLRLLGRCAPDDWCLPTNIFFFSFRAHHFVREPSARCVRGVCLPLQSNSAVCHVPSRPLYRGLWLDLVTEAGYNVARIVWCSGKRPRSSLPLNLFFFYSSSFPHATHRKGQDDFNLSALPTPSHMCGQFH